MENSINKNNKENLRPLKDLIRPLCYFDVFSYPLSLTEIRLFAGKKIDEQTENSLLNHLMEAQIVQYTNGYYHLPKDPILVEIRKTNNERAEKYLKIAGTMSKLIKIFPFVRGIGISGSLSKGSMPIDSDIDYFIITKSGRLWLCRSILIFFKKVFLLNSRKYFCLNYFIDEDHLEIEEKNLFTATEIFTLLPTYGNNLFSEFFSKNAWVEKYYFNWEKGMNRSNNPKDKRNFLQKIIEVPFFGWIGNALDKWLMHITINHWHKKFEDFDKAKFDLTLKSRPYISKHHPLDFQTKVLEAFEINKKLYDDKLDEFLNKKIVNQSALKD
jgi:hypothetical protein